MQTLQPVAQQELVPKDNKVFRTYIRKKLITEFELSSDKNITKDILFYIEDYILPSVVSFFLESEDSDFLKYLENTSLQYGEYSAIYSRISSFLNTIIEEGLFEKDRILGDLHPYNSTKFLIGNLVQYHKYPDYGELLETMSKEIFTDYKRFFPRITKNSNKEISRDYIEINKHTSNLKDIEEYYYNLGRFIPFLLFLRSIDINAENLIINLPYPVFFDMESIFSGEFSEQNQDYSILNTGVTSSSPLNDNSLLTGGLLARESLLKPLIVKDGEKPTIKWRTLSKSKFDNIPYLNDKPINPEGFFLFFEKGYLETVKKIEEKKNMLIKIPRDIEAYTRVILRPTRIYRLLLLMSCYPQVYTTEDIKTYLRREVNKYPYIYDFNSAGVEQKEVDALSNLLIPVFYSSIHNKDIISPNGQIVGTFAKSQYEVWKQFVEEDVGKSFFREQLEIIEKNLKISH